MRVGFDSFSRYEKPVFTLCNPGSELKYDGTLTKALGMLSDYEAEEISFVFNAPFELNFRLNKTGQNDTYDKVEKRRLIFVEEIGFFIIEEVSSSTEGDFEFKDVKAKSVESELSNRMLPYIENGTYPLIHSERPEEFTFEGTIDRVGIADQIVASLPLWHIGKVDDGLIDKFRTFEDLDESKNCLGFLLGEVQDAFECVVDFDLMHRLINFYSRDNYIKPTDIHLTKDDLIKTLKVSEKADEIYTALSVFGEDNISINPVNPLGTAVIYNFDHYLDWMTDGLRAKVVAWQDEMSVHNPGNSQMIIAENDGWYTPNENYYDKAVSYYDYANIKNDIDLEIGRLELQLGVYKRCLENIIAEKKNPELKQKYTDKINSVSGEEENFFESIDELIAYLSLNIPDLGIKIAQQRNKKRDCESIIAELREAMDEITTHLSFENYFTAEELEELSSFIFEGTYKDEFVKFTDIMSYEDKFKQMKDLYQRGSEQLRKSSRPVYEFSVDTESFVFADKFQKWSSQLESGCVINVEVGADDIAELFLLRLDVNYDDKNIKLNFGNRLDGNDTKSLFDNVMGNISKTANSISYIKDTIYPLKRGEFSKIKEELSTSRNLTMENVLASENEEVLIDEHGYTGRSISDTGEISPEQIKIVGKNIVFTDDGWETCKTAIGELSGLEHLLGTEEKKYGINAEAIVGDMIVGGRLRIVDDNGVNLIETLNNEVKITSEKVNNITGVTTSTGFTFNDEGLTIAKKEAAVKNIIDNEGMSIRRSADGEDVLVSNDRGVNALNVTVRKYLMIGEHSRFEENEKTGEVRTGCYWI